MNEQQVTTLYVEKFYFMNAFSVFDINTDAKYFNTDAARRAITNAAAKAYMPVNEIIIRILSNQKEQIKLQLDISGAALEQMADFCPEVLDSFRKLIEAGNITCIAKPYYNCDKQVCDNEEYAKQVSAHTNKLKQCFGEDVVIAENVEHTGNIINYDQFDMRKDDETTVKQALLNNKQETSSKSCELNNMQKTAMKELYGIKDIIFKTQKEKAIEAWRKLSAKEHIIAMGSEEFSEIAPYDTPYETYIAFMNILNDIILHATEKRPDMPMENISKLVAS